MDLKEEPNTPPDEKQVHDAPAYDPTSLRAHVRGRQFSVDPVDRAMLESDQNMLHRELKGRHMQMIAM